VYPGNGRLYDDGYQLIFYISGASGMISAFFQTAAIVVAE
jgi:hypothetical protein